MSWIEQDPESTKNLPPVISVMSINEQAMKAVQNLNANITFGASALTRVQEESISTVVAAANRCRY
jgi:alkylhydroperoxidase family enzyme